ncbi:hypothetical protein BGZ96_003306 [Linnemannia gamsii]|uniref:WW domain-containing protein n=1 Tax=Linnemannia gamsii TaxID=64522 RepID=A0ABQ7KFW7_9FUNG|nr:hypothetical protein BGZ96_003306 [Linnemannia gamsii]
MNAPSTLPPGWICQFDPKTQRLFYIYQPTQQVTWAHPLGQAADQQENARYHQLQQQYQRPPPYMPTASPIPVNGAYSPYPYPAATGAPIVVQQQAPVPQKHHGPGTGASLAMGAVAGGAVGLAAGSLLSSGLHHNYGGYGGYGYPGGYGYGGDIYPAYGVGGGNDVTIIENNNYGGFGGGGNDVTIIENNNYGGFGGGNDVTIIENNDYGGGGDVTVIENNDFGGGDFGGSDW